MAFPTLKLDKAVRIGTGAASRGAMERRGGLRWFGDVLARIKDRERLSRMDFSARQDLGSWRVSDEIRKLPWER